MENKDKESLETINNDAMLNTSLISVLARNETLDIIVNLINVLASFNLFNQEQLNILQSFVNQESKKTTEISDNLFSKINELVSKTSLKTSDNSDKKEDDDICMF